MGKRSFERRDSLFEGDDTLLSASEELGSFLEVRRAECDDSSEVVEGFVRRVGVGSKGELEKEKMATRLGQREPFLLSSSQD